MPSMRRLPRSILGAAGALAVVLCGGVALSVWGGAPKRFAQVDEGVFRSGELTPATLEREAREHGLRTVVSLLNPEAPESVAEQAAARRLGLRWINVPLRGNGASTPEDREQIKAALFDPANRPLLVHCAAGVNRTGLAVGMYRLHQQGWTLEQVMAEMRAFDFEDEPHHENLRAALQAEAERTRCDPP